MNGPMPMPVAAKMGGATPFPHRNLGRFLHPAKAGRKIGVMPQPLQPPMMGGPLPKPPMAVRRPAVMAHGPNVRPQSPGMGVMLGLGGPGQTRY